MGLSDIAAGLVTVEHQENRGVAVVDRTDASLRHAIEPFVDELPCAGAAAVTIVESYTSANSVGDAATEAGVPPVTAAKTLHLLGFDGLSPISPLGRDVLGDWLDAEISRVDALALTDASEAEFALAAYIETHPPLEGAAERIRDASSSTADAMVEKRDALADTMSDATTLR
jgi:hypothetical protein